MDQHPKLVSSWEKPVDRGDCDELHRRLSGGAKLIPNSGSM